MRDRLQEQADLLTLLLAGDHSAEVLHGLRGHMNLVGEYFPVRDGYLPILTEALQKNEECFDCFGEPMCLLETIVPPCNECGSVIGTCPDCITCQEWARQEDERLDQLDETARDQERVRQGYP